MKKTIVAVELLALFSGSCAPHSQTTLVDFNLYGGRGTGEVLFVELWAKHQNNVVCYYQGNNFYGYETQNEIEFLGPVDTIEVDVFGITTSVIGSHFSIDKDHPRANLVRVKIQGSYSKISGAHQIFNLKNIEIQHRQDNEY